MTQSAPLIGSMSCGQAEKASTPGDVSSAGVRIGRRDLCGLQYAAGRGCQLCERKPAARYGARRSATSRLPIFRKAAMAASWLARGLALACSHL